MGELLKLVGYIILGLVQGLTEVFPVSSSAHLVLARSSLKEMFGLQGFTFEVAVVFHVGTFAAIFAFYQKDVIRLWRDFATASVAWVRRQALPPHAPAPDGAGARLFVSMLAGVLVTGGIGLLLEGGASALFEQPVWVAALLVLNGLVILGVAPRATGTKKMEELPLWAYVLIGAAQGLAVLPGISRFGMSLCAGLLLGLGWYDALKLSFLLSLPTVLGSATYESAKILLGGGLAATDLLGIVIGSVVSAGAGYLGIKLIVRRTLHSRAKLAQFGVYCVVLGLYALTFFGLLG